MEISINHRYSQHLLTPALTSHTFCIFTPASAEGKFISSSALPTQLTKNGFCNGLSSRRLKSPLKPSRTDWHPDGCASAPPPAHRDGAGRWTQLPKQPAASGFPNTWCQLCAGVSHFMAQVNITLQSCATLMWALACRPPAKAGLISEVFKIKLVQPCFTVLRGGCSAQPCPKPFLLARLRVGAHLILLQTQHTQRRAGGLLWAVLQAAGGCWVPWVGTETLSWCLLLSALPQQKPACPTSNPGLLCKALEGGGVSTGKTLLFLLHMILHPSGALCLPCSSNQVFVSLGNTGCILPGTSPGEDDLPFPTFLEEKR